MGDFFSSFSPHFILRVTETDDVGFQIFPLGPIVDARANDIRLLLMHCGQGGPWKH